ncbi:MAG: SDR family oxidoreductase [Bacteroidota bacterium]
MKTYVILGATSDVGEQFAYEVARSEKENCQLLLTARSPERLAPLKSDLEITTGASVETLAVDAMDIQSATKYLGPWAEKADWVALFLGYLGDQEEAQNSGEEASRIMQVNYNGAVQLLDIFARSFATKKQGTIVGVASVAGLRGRQSNYYYGSAKAGFIAYLSGLRNRLYHQNVHVLTVLPGFMDTKMTADLDLPGPLTAQPDQAARHIFRSAKKKKNQVYVLPIWRWIMLIITTIPEGIFKRLSL